MPWPVKDPRVVLHLKTGEALPIFIEDRSEAFDVAFEAANVGYALAGVFYPCEQIEMIEVNGAKMRFSEKEAGLAGVKSGH